MILGRLEEGQLAVEMEAPFCNMFEGENHQFPHSANWSFHVLYYLAVL